MHTHIIVLQHFLHLLQDKTRFLLALYYINYYRKCKEMTVGGAQSQMQVIHCPLSVLPGFGIQYTARRTWEQPLTSSIYPTFELD